MNEKKLINFIQTYQFYKSDINAINDIRDSAVHGKETQLRIIIHTELKKLTYRIFDTVYVN